jgi:anti-sigma factor RsiW
MRITRDELEYTISQYLDGTLDPLAQATLEDTLATDGVARALLADYQRLNGALKAMPMPEIAWDEFAARINAETAKHDVPVKHYRLNFATWSKVATLAAMVTIIVGAIVKLRPQPASIAVNPGTSLRSNPEPVVVQISAPPAIAQAPVAEIQIGQPSGFAAADYHSDAIVSAPSSIWIASGTGSAQDTDPSLY